MSNHEYPPPVSFFPGRWQPLHAGHVAIIRQVLDQGRKVVVGIMRTPRSKRNPYSVEQRKQMFRDEFWAELACGYMELLEMPWVEELCHGRDCGWGVRYIEADEQTREISGTAIREELSRV